MVSEDKLLVVHPISNSFTDSYKRFRRINYWWLIPLVIHPLILQRNLKKKGHCEGGNYSEDILLVAHPISNSFTDRLLHNIHVSKPLSAFTLKGWSWKWLKQIPIIGMGNVKWRSWRGITLKEKYHEKWLKEMTTSNVFTSCNHYLEPALSGKHQVCSKWKRSKNDLNICFL